MPRIPTYTSTLATEGLHPSDLGVRAFEEEGRGISSAAHQIGQDIAQVGETYQKQADAADLTAGQAKNNQDIFQWHQDATQALQSYDATKDPDHQFIPNFMDTNVAKSDDAFQESISGYSSRVREELTRSRAEAKQALRLRMLGETAQAQGDQAVANRVAGLESLARTAGDDPTMLGPVIQKHRADNEALLGHGLSRADVDKANIADSDSLAYSTANAQLERMGGNVSLRPQDVDTFRAQVNDPKGDFYNNLSQEHRNDINEKLDRLGNTQQGITFGLLKQQLPDLYTQIDRGGDPAQARQAVQWLGANARTKEEILAANDAAHDLTQHEQYGSVFAKTKDLPNADIQTAIDQTRAAWADAKTPEDRARLKGQEAALTQARDQRNAEFHADPASYAIANDGATNARYRAFAAKPTPESWQAYSQSASAYQRRLFPGEVPKLVTAEVRDDIRQGIQAITADKTNGVQAAAGTLQKWAGMTGSSWSSMSRELHTAGILNDDQFVAATLYGKPSGRHLAEQMLQASAMTGKDLYVLHGVSSDKAAQAAIAELQSLSQSLGNMGEDGAEIQRANTMALAHLLQLRGDANQAPDLAKTLILDEFQFTGRNGSTTLRIPNRPDLDAGRIQHGTDSVLSGLGENKAIIVPFSNSGLNTGDQRKVYLDRLQHTGVWYTNGSNTGAELWDIDGGSPVQEYDASGKPQKVFRTWRQLSDLGAAADSSSGDANIQAYERASGGAH